MRLLRFMKKTRIIYLIYKRFRTACGVTLGFVLIYAAYTKNINLALIPLAIGSWCIQECGDCYNDYQNYEEDIRNKRKDKWTTTGLITRKQMKIFSISLCIIGLTILFLFSTPYVFLLGLICAGTGFTYSHPRFFNFKEKNLLGYVIVAIPIFFFPFAFNTHFNRRIQTIDIIYGCYCFFQYLYLYCQKDATDPNDMVNLFLKFGWKNSSILCIIFGTISLMFFLPFIFNFATLLFTFGLMLLSKILNTYSIYIGKTSREIRSKFVLMEFIVPYIYFGGTLLG